MLGVRDHVKYRVTFVREVAEDIEAPSIIMAERMARARMERIGGKMRLLSIYAADLLDRPDPPEPRRAA